MAVILVCEDIKKPFEHEAMAHTGPLIEFFQKHYPDGFGGRQCVVHVNRRLLAIDDWDYVVRDSDEIVAVFTPGDAATVGNIIIQIAVAVVSYYVRQALTPDNPATATPEASPIYSVGVGVNEARLGAVVPVQYGEFLRSPDLASQSYRKFIDNNEERYYLLCLGAGYFDESSVQLYLGNTPISDLPSGDVNYQVFSPDDHGQSIGSILNSTGFHENVYTSGEVANQELPKRVETSADIYNGVVRAVTSGNTVTLPSDPGVYGLYAGVDFEFEATGAGGFPGEPGNSSNIAGSYTVQSVSGNVVTITGIFSANTVEFVNLIVPAATTDQTIGPFVACAAGQTTQRIELDFEWPRGLYDQSGSSLIDENVTIYIAIEPIDDNSNSLGAPLFFSETVSEKTTTHQRRSFFYDVPQGRYRVYLNRNEVTEANDTPSRQSTTMWTGLKAYLDHDGSAVYGETTLIAVTVKASEQLSAASLNRIQVRSNRLLPDVDGTGLATHKTAAHACADIYSNSNYGAGRPHSEIDVTEFSNFATNEPSSFNAVFDTKTTIFRALDSVSKSVFADAIFKGQRLSVDHDLPKPTRSALFTIDNMLPGSLRKVTQIGSEGDIDGIEIEYLDNQTSEPVTTIYPATSVRPQYIKLFGCTDAARAEYTAQRLWITRLVRSSVVEFGCEMEGRIAQRGERIAVADPSFNWGDAAIVRSGGGSLAVVDRHLTDSATAGSALFRSAIGNVYGPVGVSVNGNQITLTSGSLDPEYTDNAHDEGCLVSVAMGGATYRDIVITDISSGVGNTWNIRGYPYSTEPYV